MRILAIALLGLAAFAPLALIEAALAPMGASGWFVGQALADDDDDDDRPRRRGPRFMDDDDDDGPRWRRPRMTMEFDDDDDDDQPRRRAAPPRERPRPARQAARPEIVATNIDAAALGRIRSAGFSVLAERRLTFLPEATVRLAAPRNLSAARAGARLAELAPGALVDANAIYRPNAREDCPPGRCFPYRLERWETAACAARGLVGMIDTRVEAGHRAFSNRAIETFTTRSAGRAISSTAHGTEVAILLTGAKAEPDDLKLFAVDAFHKLGGGDQADVFDLVAAIDWLVERNVAVINLSLAGPPNAVLDRAGAVAAAKGVIFVAAVGNDGPKSKPRFPAAYPWAVAVTAVDARGEPYARAVRGAHVAFAAPGVRLELPDAALNPGRERSGTSYAAPLVTAALSALKAETGERPSAETIAALATRVEDKGAPGRDPVFGWGALANGSTCPSAAVAAPAP